MTRWFGRVSNSCSLHMNLTTRSPMKNQECDQVVRRGQQFLFVAYTPYNPTSHEKPGIWLGGSEGSAIFITCISTIMYDKGEDIRSRGYAKSSDTQQYTVTNSDETNICRPQCQCCYFIIKFSKILPNLKEKDSTFRNGMLDWYIFIIQPVPTSLTICELTSRTQWYTIVVQRHTSMISNCFNSGAHEFIPGFL